MDQNDHHAMGSCGTLGFLSLPSASVPWNCCASWEPPKVFHQNSLSHSQHSSDKAIPCFLSYLSPFLTFLTFLPSPFLPFFLLFLAFLYLSYLSPLWLSSGSDKSNFLKKALTERIGTPKQSLNRKDRDP